MYKSSAIGCGSDGSIVFSRDVFLHSDSGGDVDKQHFEGAPATAKGNGEEFQTDTRFQASDQPTAISSKQAGPISFPNHITSRLHPNFVASESYPIASTDALEKVADDCRSTSHECAVHIVDELEHAVREGKLNGALPAVLSGALPAVLNGTLPAVINKALPAVLNKALPAVLNKALPAVLNGTQPALLNGTLPAVLEGALPTLLNGTLPAVPLCLGGAFGSVAIGPETSSVLGSESTGFESTSQNYLVNLCPSEMDLVRSLEALPPHAKTRISPTSLPPCTHSNELMYTLSSMEMPPPLPVEDSFPPSLLASTVEPITTIDWQDPSKRAHPRTDRDPQAESSHGNSVAFTHNSTGGTTAPPFSFQLLAGETYPGFAARSSPSAPLLKVEPGIFAAFSDLHQIRNKPAPSSREDSAPPAPASPRAIRKSFSLNHRLPVREASMPTISEGRQQAALQPPQLAMVGSQGDQDRPSVDLVTSQDSNASSGGNCIMSSPRQSMSLPTLQRAMGELMLTDDQRLKTISQSLQGISSLMKETNRLEMSRDASGATCINQYVVVKSIGRGSFGKVKLCLNTMDGKMYAVKMLDRSFIVKQLQKPQRSLRRRITRGTSTPSLPSSARPSIDVSGSPTFPLSRKEIDFPMASCIAGEKHNRVSSDSTIAGGTGSPGMQSTRMSMSVETNPLEGEV
eukprot:gene15341-21428_t